MGYLMLTRRPGDAIDLTLTTPLPAGTRIVILVAALDHRNTRIGIDAPRSVVVDRHEITERKDLEVNGNVS